MTCLQDGVWAHMKSGTEALKSPNQLAKGQKTFEMEVFLTVFSLKTVVKIIISNSISD